MSRHYRMGLEITAEVVDPPLPAAQTISFGAKTLKGFGGHDLGYTGGDTLSITDGNTGSVWTFNSFNELVLAGTYGSAPPELSGPYTLTVTDGVSTGTVTVNILADTHHVHAWYLAAGTGTNAPTASTASSNQLKTVLQLSGLAMGDTVLVRPGDYNPAMNLTTITRTGVVSGTWSGSNWVEVQAEVERETVVGRLHFSGTSAENQYMRFSKFKFYGLNTIGADGANFGLIDINGGAIGFLKIEDNLFQGDTSKRLATNVTSSSLVSGVGMNRAGCHDITVVNNEFDCLDTGVAITGARAVVRGNTFDSIFIDCIQASQVTEWDISFNRMLNHKSATDGSHGDFIQLNQDGMAAGTYVGGPIDANIMVRGAGTAGYPDGQGIFLPDQDVADGAGNVWFTDVTVRGNFYLGSATRGINIARCIDPEVSNNMLLSDVGSNYLTPATTVAIYTEYCNGGNIRNNVTNSGISETSPVLAATKANNHTLTATLANYQGQFVNPQLGPNNISLAQIIADWANAPGGTYDSTSPDKAGCIGTGYVDYEAETESFPH